MPPPASAGMTENVASALCYVLGLITGIIFLVLAPYNQNRTVRFHAFQSIFLHASVIVCYFVLGFLLGILRVVGMFVIWPLIGIGFFILWIYMIVSAYNGRMVELPVIGPLARQQA
jgi:uncharacterized membrane protein